MVLFLQSLIYQQQTKQILGTREQQNQFYIKPFPQLANESQRTTQQETHSSVSSVQGLKQSTYRVLGFVFDIIDCEFYFSFLIDGVFRWEGHTSQEQRIFCTL